MATVTVEDPDSPFPNRRYYSVGAASLPDLTESFPIAGQHFVLFLAWDARSASDESIRAFARHLLSRGLVYLVAWGPDCSRVHDVFDFTDAEEEVASGQQRSIMTTWHEDESLASALWFFLFNTEPDEAYAATTAVAVAAAVGNEEWTRAIRSYLNDKNLLDRDAEV